MNYHFSGFNYDTEQKILKYGTHTLELTKKYQTLLAYVLSRPNQLISRDDLITHVWQGRVVTHSTIDQSISKLKKDLNQIHKDQYFEAVKGQGFLFLPKVSVDSSESNKTTGSRFNLEWITLIATLVFLFIWLTIKSNDKSVSLPTNASTDAEPTSTQVPSLSTPDNKLKQDNGLLDGSAVYLDHLIQQYPTLTPVKPGKEPTSTKHTLTIDIIQDNLKKLTLQLNLQAFAAHKSTGYLVDLSLFDEQSLIASQQIKSKQLSQLFPQSARWLAQQLGIEAINQTSDSNTFSQNEFALQSYFRAMYAQANGDNNKALTHLHTAIEQDSKFEMAWYEMAVTLWKTSEPSKAIEILQAITTADRLLAFKIALAKAQCFDSIGDFDAASQMYANALLLAENNLDSSRLSQVYINQAKYYSKSEQFQLAQQALAQAKSVTDATQQPQLYGTMMITHAKLAKNNKQPLLAIEKAKQAIVAFQHSGDLTQQMQAKTTLASILLHRNEFNQAEQLLKETLLHAEKQNDLQAISNNRNELAKLFQQTGRFRLAEQQWQSVLTLSAELGLSENSAEAYLWLLQMHLSENNNTQAGADLQKLTQLFHDHPTHNINKKLLVAQLIMAVYQKDMPLSQELLTQLVSNGQELKQVYQGDVALLQQKESVAEMHYLEALLFANTKGRFDQMVMILNRLNALYLIEKSPKLTENLNRTSRLKPFIYPFQKYQAQAIKLTGNHIKALSLMEELKLKSGDFWQSQDQLLLESWKKQQQ